MDSCEDIGIIKVTDVCAQVQVKFHSDDDTIWLNIVPSLTEQATKPHCEAVRKRVWESELSWKRAHDGGAREREQTTEEQRSERRDLREREREQVQMMRREREGGRVSTRERTRICLEDIEGECNGRAVVVCESAHEAN